MALAQRHAGVVKGYQAKAKRIEKVEPSFLQVAVKTLVSSAREIREFMVDEIVYETMDTVRLVRYLKYQLGFRPRRAKPAATKREVIPASPMTQPEGVPVFVKR